MVTLAADDSLGPGVRRLGRCFIDHDRQAQSFFVFSILI